MVGGQYLQNRAEVKNQSTLCWLKTWISLTQSFILPNHSSRATGSFSRLACHGSKPPAAGYALPDSNRPVVVAE